jgi:predicted amidophosphoribosyltransferase
MRDILVDDIVTTGATTDFCTEVLLNGGAESVSVISLART